MKSTTTDIYLFRYLLKELTAKGISPAVDLKYLT